MARFPKFQFLFQKPQSLNSYYPKRYPSSPFNIPDLLLFILIVYILLYTSDCQQLSLNAWNLKSERFKAEKRIRKAKVREREVVEKNSGDRT